MFTNYPTTTKLGALTVTPTQGTHIHAEGLLTTRGVTYKASAHLHVWNDGLFHIGKEFITDGNGRITEPVRRSGEWEQRRDVYASRQPWNGDEASTAAKNVIIAAIEPAVQAWVKTNALALVIAERQFIEREIETTERELREAEAVVAEKQTELKDLRKALKVQELADLRLREVAR